MSLLPRTGRGERVRHGSTSGASHRGGQGVVFRVPLSWLKASHRIERERPARLGYDDPRGDLTLRRSLQAYLARAKGLTCEVEREIVIHVGTFSKTLSPQLRLGYMVLPARLATAFAAAKRLIDRHAASVTQRILASLIESGAYERHVRRIRRIQHDRQRTLLVSLQRYLPGRVTVQGAASGLHMVAWINDLSYAQEDALVLAARRERVQVYPLSPFYMAPPGHTEESRPAGLVLGYALLPPDQIEVGIRRLSAALR
jgi:DNA-binding transcriptional MocR family regulator